MAKAIVVHRVRRTRGPDTRSRSPTLSPAAGEVAIRVEAAGVNPIDGKLRSGLRPSGPIDEPRRVGGDGAGVVTAVGDGVDGFRVGDAVVFSGASGAYATDVVVSAERVHARPPQVSAAEGAALGIPVGTAYQALRSLDVGPGDTLLVHARLGRRRPGRHPVRGALGRDGHRDVVRARFDRVRELGATPVGYGEGLWSIASAPPRRRASPSRSTPPAPTRRCRPRSSSSPTAIASSRLVRGRDAASFGIRAFAGGARLRSPPQQLGWRGEAIPVTLALLAAGRFSIELGPSFPLADAADAHRIVESGVDGKVTLVP